jgi:biopolymer transport protein TolR
MFGRLERTPAPKPMSEINMTPLVDVMLVLVVIFILTAPLLTSSLRLDLPASAAAQTQAQEPMRAVRLGLDKAGQVYLDDQPMTLDAVKTRLMQIAQQNPLSEVQLWADQAAPYGQVVVLMGLAQQAGLSRLGFVAKP